MAHPRVGLLQLTGSTTVMLGPPVLVRVVSICSDAWDMATLEARSRVADRWSPGNLVASSTPMDCHRQANSRAVLAGAPDDASVQSSRP